MSDTGSKAEGGRSTGNHAHKAPLGRRIGIALFWLMAAYVVGMSAFSIIPSLYFPNIAPLPSDDDTRSCAKQLRALERELTSHTTAHFSQSPPPRLAQWLSAWDHRYAALPADCGTLQEAREQLVELRDGLETLLRRYDREHAAARLKLRKALDAVALPE